MGDLKKVNLLSLQMANNISRRKLRIYTVVSSIKDISLDISFLPGTGDGSLSTRL